MKQASVSETTSTMLTISNGLLTEILIKRRIIRDGWSISVRQTRQAGLLTSKAGRATKIGGSNTVTGLRVTGAWLTGLLSRTSNGLRVAPTSNEEAFGNQ